MAAEPSPAKPKKTPSKKEKKKMGAVMDDLCTRFILNCPPEDLQGGERILFQVETAWWFYEDNYRSKDQSLQQFKLYGFADKMFQHCPLLQPLHSELPALMKAFNDYRWSVPVCGCIMLSAEMDKVLLVKGWNKWANWTFPKGKISKDEEKLPCAVREVMEETGFDCGPLMSEPDFIDMKINGKQDVRLYIVVGVPLDFAFAPHTKGEISKIEFIKLKELKEQKGEPKPGRFDVSKTYAVLPFIPKLKQWIKERKARGGAPPSPAVVAGAFDVSQLEQQAAGISRGAVMDVAELEARQAAAANAGAGAVDVRELEKGAAPGVVPGAFDVSALEAGSSGSSAQGSWTTAPQEEKDMSARSRDMATFGTDQKLNDGERDDLFKQYAAIAEKERQRPIKTSAQIGGSAGATAERSKGSSTGSEGDDSFKCPVRGVKVQAQFKESYMSGKQFAKEAKLMAAKKAANGLSAKKVAEVEAAYGADFWSKWQADAGRSRKGKAGAPAPAPAAAAPVKILSRKDSQGRPIVTASQLGGSAGASGGDGGGAAKARKGRRKAKQPKASPTAGLVAPAAATWQQRKLAAATGNPLLDWRLPPGFESAIFAAAN